MYRSLIRKSKANYYKDKLNEYWGNMKKTWGLINEILGRKKRSFNFPDYFVENGKLVSGNFDIANGFNDFFTSIGEKLASNIDSTNTSFKDYLNNPNKILFTFPKVNPTQIRDVAKLLKSKNSAGHDKISLKLLKEIIHCIDKPLSYLFNLSFQTGYVPKQFKIAKVIPIYKLNTFDKEDMSSFSNYRPISLLSSFGKLLEKIVSKQMFGYLSKYEVLFNHQYGFRPKHSTTYPLIQFANKIFQALNSKTPEYTIGIFLDIKKAFDCVDFNILLEKLKHYGFSGAPLLWFKNYLENRSQFVNLNGTYSNMKNISQGVPQGSILGPILFLLYINDLPFSNNLFTSLFADDTVFVKSSSNIDSLLNETNIELGKAFEWFKANKLTLNVSKTKYMIFRNKKMHINDSVIDLKVDGKSLERIGENFESKYFKFVGMRLDEYMSWKYHLEHVCYKVSIGNNILNRTKNFLPLYVRKSLYNSLVKSQIMYGIILYGGSTNQGMKRLELTQKKCIRNIANSGYRSHTTPKFLTLNLLKIKDIFKFESMIFMYKYANDLHPNSLSGLFYPLSNNNRTLSFKTSIIKGKSLESFPSAFLPKIWNNLHINTKTITKLISFKKIVKKDLLGNYEGFSCKKDNCIACKNNTK